MVDVRDHVLVFISHAIGGFLATGVFLAFGGRFMRWGKESIQAIHKSALQLVDHASWAHGAIRAIAQAVHAAIPEAPRVVAPDIDTPPPAGPSFEEISGSWRR